MINKFLKFLSTNHKIVNIQCRFNYTNSEQFITTTEKALENRLLNSMYYRIIPDLKPKNFKLLKESVIKRKYQIDLTKIQECFDVHHKFHRKSVNQITKIKRLEKLFLEDTSRQNFKKRIIDEKKKLSAINNEKLNYSELLSVHIIRLPNYIHESTPEETVETLNISSVNLGFPPKSHIEIGQANKEISFQDGKLSFYYLKGKLPLIELACSNFFSNFLLQNKFIQQSNLDLWKDIVFEACGIDHNDLNKTLCVNLGPESEYHSLVYLSGGSSIASFAAFFARSTLETDEYFPLRLVNIGRKYQPQIGEPSLFNSFQSTSVDAFIVSKQENIFEEFIKAKNNIVQVYKESGFHFKVVHYCPTDLKSYESAGFGIQMYSNYSKEYIEVGRISLCEDFISRKILSSYFNKKKKQVYTSMIHIQVVNVTKLIGILLENFQNQDMSYNIPDWLENELKLYI